MSLLKYIERAKRMDDLIRRRATGGAEEFAQRLGISRSLLMEHIRDLKEMGAPIQFCETTKTYYYIREYRFLFARRAEMSELRGGNSFRSILGKSSMAGLTFDIFISQS